MLRIVVKGKKGLKKLDYEIQSSSVLRNLLSEDELQNIFKVSAMGLELDYIKRNMTNIPYSRNNDYATWRGDLARFIVENW